MLVCVVMVASFATSPLKASANTGQNEQLIQLLMQMIIILQGQLAVLTSQGHTNDDSQDVITRGSDDKLYFSTTFADFAYTIGESTSGYFQQMILTNGSSKNISVRIRVPNQPSWLNTGYSTELLTINSDQPMGVGISVNPEGLSAGTYRTKLIITGNFEDSPKIIPIKLRVYDSSDASISEDPVISSVTFKQDGEAGIEVNGENLDTVEKLEYSANCCKPTGEGTLSGGVIGEDYSVKFNLDTYLGNAEINELTVRLVYSNGLKSDWLTATIP